MGNGNGSKFPLNFQHEKEGVYMVLSLKEFIINLTHSLPLTCITVLILSVILVNGWTDAPNAIATCVSTRSIRPKRAILMAAVFNFFGVWRELFGKYLLRNTCSRWR